MAFAVFFTVSPPGLRQQKGPVPKMIFVGWPKKPSSNIIFPSVSSPQNKVLPGLSGFGVVGVVVLRISAQLHVTGCNVETKRSSGKSHIVSMLALNGGHDAV